VANPQFGLWIKDDETEEIDVFGIAPSAEEAYFSSSETDEDEIKIEDEETSRQSPARGAGAVEHEKLPDLDEIMLRAFGSKPLLPEEEKKKLVLRVKKLVSNPASFVEEHYYRRPFTKNEARKILFNARVFFQHVVHTSIISRYEATGQDGRSVGSCQAIWFTVHDREFCLWLRFSEEKRGWEIVKAFAVFDLVDKRKTN